MIIYSMASKGFGLDAWDNLIWSCIMLTECNGRILAAKVVIRGRRGRILIFIMPEAFSKFQKWRNNIKS